MTQAVSRNVFLVKISITKTELLYFLYHKEKLMSLFMTNFSMKTRNWTKIDKKLTMLRKISFTT